MNTMTHPREEIMALLDGELPAAEAKAVQVHIKECAECAGLRDELNGTSEALRVWTVPEFSAERARAIEERIERAARAGRKAKPRTYTALTFRNWRLWAIGGCGAVAAALALLAVVSIGIYSSAPRFADNQLYSAAEPQQASDVAEFKAPARAQMDARPAMPLPVPSRVGGDGDRSERVAGIAGMENGQLQDKPARARGVIGGAVAAAALNATTSAASGPMIARSVSMIILVKNIAGSRAALDAIVAEHHGYAAQLTMNTPENGARSFQSSLRVPAGELAASLDQLRGLGRVQTETQSGEEVTQQHTDLLARLTNARETETRLRAILQQRAGKMEDVLDVEEKISDVRGEIEQMEAEQKALEHRVDFATVDLQLTEEYKAQLDGSPISVRTKLGNSLVAGLQHAGGSLLGLILFVEEFGPVLLIWAVVLGVPVWLVWRYRRGRA